MLLLLESQQHTLHKYGSEQLDNLSKKEKREREDSIDSVTYDITSLSHHCKFQKYLFSLAKKTEHVITRAQAQWKDVSVQPVCAESPIRPGYKYCTCMENHTHTQVSILITSLLCMSVRVCTWNKVRYVNDDRNETYASE